jgi:hypothetical protein
MKVSIVYDEFGQIVSVNRPSKDAKVVVLSDSRQSILETDISDYDVESMLSGYRVDAGNRSLVKASAQKAADKAKSS